MYMYMYTYMPNYASLGQGQHVFPLPLSTIPQMYNVNTCPIGFSLPVSSNITTNVHVHNLCMYMYCIYTFCTCTRVEWIACSEILACIYLG